MLLKIRNKNFSWFGYSLVEVLVVLSILAVLFGAGYANYRDFGRRQSITNAAKSVQADIRQTQSMALAGQIPNDARCILPNTLNGYYFSILSATQYEIRASCSGGAATNATKTITLNNGVTITSTDNQILFKVLGQGTDIPSGNVTITLTQTATGSTSTTTVSSIGQIQ